MSRRTEKMGGARPISGRKYDSLAWEGCESCRITFATTWTQVALLVRSLCCLNNTWDTRLCLDGSTWSALAACRWGVGLDEDVPASDLPTNREEQDGGKSQALRRPRAE